MSAIFLPLRSNAAWFADEDSHSELGRRIKRLLLFHDALAVEDGRYTASFVARGASDHFFPPTSIRDRARIQYRSLGTGYQVRVARSGTDEFSPIISGALQASFEVDFWPVLSEAGITGADYIRWIEYELTDESKEIVRQAVFRARLDPRTEEGLPENRFLRGKIVEALHSDSMLAAGMGMPLSVDHHASLIVERSNMAATSRWRPEARAALADAWLTLGLPDPGAFDWDVVLRARESAAGADLRRLVDQLCAQAVFVLTGELSSADWREEARRLLVRELVTELLERRIGIADVGMNLGLSLIPYASTPISTALDVRRLVSETRSWVSLLADLGPRTQIEVRD